jgi:cytochrome c oxidase subunit 2
MRIVIFGMSVFVAVAVFVTMFLSILSTRGSGEGDASFRQSVFVEIVWALIPCLMVVAAAVPAAIAIVSSHAAH